MRERKAQVSFLPGNLWKSILIFAGTALVCMGLLLAVCAGIPQRAIADNCKKAEVYFSANEGFPLLIERVEGSRLDHYADCALFNVIYNTDSEKPFVSMVAAPYYRIEGNDIRADYRSCVIDGEEPNNEYSRYWHGSQVLLRPLLTVTSIEGCRTALFALFLVLNAVLGFILIRKKAFIPLAAYFAALIAVQVWVAAFTLEYIMVLLVMAGQCVAIAAMWSAAAQQEQARLERRMTGICIVGGTVTCFLDFLTAETLSFTVPVILLLMLLQKDGEVTSLRIQLGRILKWGAAWLCAYAAMFAVKWLLVLAVSGQDAFLRAFENAALRMGGDGMLADGTMVEFGIAATLARNIACLIPFAGEMTVNGVAGLAFGVLAVWGAAVYLLRKERLNIPYMATVMLVGILPYIRYLCLPNHAHTHYFFTYRAQMAFVMALIAVTVHAVMKEKETAAKGRTGQKAGGRR